MNFTTRAKRRRKGHKLISVTGKDRVEGHKGVVPKMLLEDYYLSESEFTGLCTSAEVAMAHEVEFAELMCCLPGLIVVGIGEVSVVEAKDTPNPSR